MFSIEQIHSAHSKVKSGADFPAYIRDLNELGVVHYATYVTDGHTDFYGKNGDKAVSPAKYDALAIVGRTDSEQFLADLKAHQQGSTDYPTFCLDCAKSGIEKWVVDIAKMTCTYFDKTGEAVLTEQIPG